MVFLIVDGGIHTADYLWQHGVHPSSITFTREQMLEDITYGDEEQDRVLFVVHGCTTMKYGDALVIIEELLNATNIKSFTVMSDVPINTKRYNPPLEYYYYEGDIFGKNVYLRKSNDYKGVSMTKVKDNPLNDFMGENVTEDQVTIAPMDKQYIIPQNDSVPLKDVARIRLFDK
jgi:hypothetical protein